MENKAPRLIADIGGTHARFALSTQPREFQMVKTLACGQYLSLADAIRHYLELSGAGDVQDAVIAIATPVLGDKLSMTNLHWSFSIEATRRLLGLRTLLLINDFSALAMSLPFLAEDELLRLDQQGALRPGLKAVIGPGTGLGVAGLVPVEGGWQTLSTEGGHVDLAPADPFEMEILKVLWLDYAHVSAERILSGPGINLLYRALCQISGIRPATEDTASIVKLAKTCPVARQTLETFSAFMGAVAGNLALTFGALGGVYLGGGVLGKLGEHFDVAKYRQRFVDKGRFRPYLEAIPNYLITAAQPAFLGAAQQLQQYLQRTS